MSKTSVGIVGIPDEVRTRALLKGDRLNQYVRYVRVCCDTLRWHQFIVTARYPKQSQFVGQFRRLVAVKAVMKFTTFALGSICFPLPQYLARRYHQQIESGDVRWEEHERMLSNQCNLSTNNSTRILYLKTVLVLLCKSKRKRKGR
jgi:hypothetical protein